MSIKDADTERLVRELARRRGEGVTGAIRRAVANELARDDQARQRAFATVWSQVQEIQRQFAALPALMTMAEIDADMYDETGAPR